MSQWFYRCNGAREYGPFASSELLDLIRRGEIDGSTELRKNNSPWVAACEVNGLWQAAGLPSVIFRCPYCESEILKPPTKCKSCLKEVGKAVGHLIRNHRNESQAKTWSEANRRGPAKPKAPPLQ